MKKPSVKKNRKQKIDPASHWMDYELCSLHTGISIETLKNMVKKQEIPHSCPRNRRLIRFHRDRIDEWLMDQEVDPRADQDIVDRAPGLGQSEGQRVAVS